MAIDVEIQRFTAKGIAIDCPRWTRDPAATRRRIIREAVTAGKPFVGARSLRALRDLIGHTWRVGSWIRARGPNALVVPSSVYRNFLPSDRARASERIGLGVARLLAAARLGASPIVMVEALPNLATRPVNLIPAPGAPSPQVPDLIGCDSHGAWHVVEAKGLSTADPRAGVTAATNQAAAVWVSSPPHSPAGPPRTASGCVTYLKEGFVPIRAVLRDPPSEDPAFELVVDFEGLVGAYYSLFKLALGSRRGLRSDDVGGEPFHVIDLEDGGSLGLHRRLYKALRRNELADALPEFLDAWSATWTELDIPDGAVGLDGVLLRGPAMA